MGRFERGEPYSTHRDAVTYRGLDPLTGLDVLIYEFKGRPTLETGTLSSERILSVLGANVKRGEEGETGTVVAALPSGASLVAPGEAVVDDRFVLQAVEAALDAQRHQVIHGDITPSRLLYSKGRVYLEGYGVPWNSGGGRVGGAKALHLDLQSLVRSLLELAGDNLSAEVTVTLRSVLSPATSPPMTAQRLYSILKRLAGGAVTVPTAGFTDLTLPVSPGHDPLRADAPVARAVSAEQATPVRAAREPAAPQRPQPPLPRPQDVRATASQGTTAGVAASQSQAPSAYPTDPDPITLNSDPGFVPAGDRQSGQGGEFTPRDTSPGFVKDLPPGATYRPGNLEESLKPAPFRFDKGEERSTRARSWRGPALLLLLLLTAGLAAYLAFMARQANEPTPAGFGLVQHTIDVSVQPTNLPPVSLVVDESPEGSTFRPGTVMGSVPRKVTFDVAGTWVVHAVFRDRITDSVTVVVPDDQAITLVFPPVGDSP